MALAAVVEYSEKAWGVIIKQARAQAEGVEGAGGGWSGHGQLTGD